ncbi:MAG: hypothetical protein EA339_14975 [Rhodobacteraceae bacterium]|nr:MAG: hypothetical protein EA339_14975 [Paracoccaceae bacterium]
MTGYSRSPRVLKGGLVLMERDSGSVIRAIALQYNPEMLNRSVSMRGAGEDGDRLEALRLSGPPVETINLEAVLDASDGLAAGNATSGEIGVAGDIAALETILYPSADSLAAQDALAARGMIEVLPVVAPLVLFVWGAKRILPVRITDFSVVEEMFDPALNPIRARITLGMRALSVNDLPFASRGGSLSMVQHRLKETLSARGTTGGLAALGADSLG